MKIIGKILDWIGGMFLMFFILTGFGVVVWGYWQLGKFLIKLIWN